MLYNFEHSESLDIKGLPVRQVLIVRGNRRQDKQSLLPLPSRDWLQTVQSRYLGFGRVRSCSAHLN